MGTEGTSLPGTIRDETELEDLLSAPSPAVIADLRRLDGDILVLGASGKVGPTLARMAKRAAPHKRVAGVARFTDAQVRQRMEGWGIETIACDLLDRAAVAKLPDFPNIVFAIGRKFGTTGSEAQTWAMNAVAPAIAGERFRDARMVAFSTLCVYPFARTDGPGSRENDPVGPPGEYANSCVGRERVLQFYSQRNRNPGRLARLNYAIDCRYGVLHDVAKRVRAGEAVDLRTSMANAIWQGDASGQILRCLLHGEIPARPINIGAAAPAQIREVAEKFGTLFGVRPRFSGQEQPTAWHTDCSEAIRLFGEPQVDLDTMIRWNADWLARGMPVYDKPTHYDNRTGMF
jgi:nucleoside-diphosphate-sugar epimerase